MNRREMLQTGLSVLSAAGIDGEIATVSPVNPQAFVITIPGLVSPDAAHRLREIWERTFKGTSCEGVKCIILEQGMKLEVIDDPKGGET